jgi:hypothetical protein
MILKSKHYYMCNISDIMVYVIKVYYQSDSYIKFKASLYYKNTGFIIETKNYKVYKKNIKHWKLYNPKDSWPGQAT